MKIVVGFITAVLVTLFFTVLLIISKRKSLVNKVEKASPQVLYLLFQALPIAVLSVVCEYITINPLICAGLWILVIFVVDKLLTRKLLLSTNADTKVALIFLSMVLCTVYFIAQGIAEGSCEYVRIFCVVGALIVGFFVPINVIVSDTFFKNKAIEIKNGLGLKYLERTTILFYAMSAVFVILEVVIEHMEFWRPYKVCAIVGGILGFTISLFIISVKTKGINNSIVDCVDWRKYIFETYDFIEYKKRVEEKIGLNSQELYDHAEAFLFYEAFASKQENSKLISEIVDSKVYEMIREDYHALKKYRIFRKATGEFILKNSQKEYAYDCLVDSWSIFILYMQSCCSDWLENGDIPELFRLKYVKWGYPLDKEQWLLFFLEKYHCLPRKIRKKMINNEMKSFLNYVYKAQAIWVIPKRCKTYLRELKNVETLDMLNRGNLLLSIAYGWFIKRENGEETRIYLSEKVKKDADINVFESWLREYDNWESFILSNKLNKLVNRKISITSNGFKEPKKCLI